MDDIFLDMLGMKINIANIEPKLIAMAMPPNMRMDDIFLPFWKNENRFKYFFANEKMLARTASVAKVENERPSLRLLICNV